MTHPGITLQVAIEHSLEQTYGFLEQPENFPKWASGLGSGVFRENGRWIAEVPGGRLEVEFSESNPYGILDHWVKLPSGEERYIPMRVIANGAGCTVLLTLLRYAETTDEDFARDQDWVERDLTTLKVLLEDGLL